MKKLFVLLTCVFMFFATGCSKKSTAPEVEYITTNSSVIILDVGETKKVDYSISPNNAEDKSIRLDTTGLNDIADVTVDDSYVITLLGKSVGSGVLSIITSNDKFISYSVTVCASATTSTGTSGNPEPEESAVDRLNNYFNAAVQKDYEVSTEYVTRADYVGWYLDFVLRAASDESENSLELVVEQFRTYFPTSLFRVLEAYWGPAPGQNMEYVLVLGNSNISVAATLCCYVIDENVHMEVLVYGCFLNGGVFY